MGFIGSAVSSLAGGMTPQNSFSAAQTNTQNYQPGIDTAEGNVNQVYGQQQSLGNALLAQSQGQGPNPAQMQLQQATDANNKMAAGQMASQKGINPGMAQKQIADASANQQQTAAGQGALLGAQQQIAAQGQLASLYNTMGSQQITQAGNLQNSLTGQASNAMQAQGINAGVSAQNAAATQNAASGIWNSIGSAVSGPGKYDGGEIKRQKFFDGGAALGADVGGWGSKPDTNQGPSLGADVGGWTDQKPAFSNSLGVDTDLSKKAPASSSSGAGSSPLIPNPAPMQDNGSSLVPNWQSGMNLKPLNLAPPSMGGGGGGDSGGGGSSMMSMLPMLAAAASKGGEIGSKALPQDHPFIQALMQQGGPVPGTPQVMRNDPKNDVQPAMLSPGEVVLPLSVTKSNNPADKAKSFVEQLKGKSDGKKGYAKVLEARRKAK